MMKTKTMSVARAARVLAVWLAAVVGPTQAVGQDQPTLLDRTARLEVEDVTVAEALVQLGRTSGVTLAYSRDLLPAERRVTCDCAEVSVRRALEIILRGTGLRFIDNGRQIVIGRSGVVDQETWVLGHVVDAAEGRPIPNAMVRTDDGRLVLSDPTGRFSIRGLDAGTHRLTGSALGYREASAPVSIEAGGSSAVTLSLEPEPIALSELVIAPGRFGVLEASGPAMGASVSRERIEATPQFGDDVFRTLKRLPGVASGDISARLNVRGSTDRNLLFLLDGAELYEPYHLQDLEGAFGIVDVQSLGGVDLVTGGFGAEYGDKLGGVFSMQTRRPPEGGARNTVGFSLSSMSFSSMGTFAEGRGQWLTTLRRGWLDIVLSLTGVEDDLSPSYWDALTRVQYVASDKHSFSGSVLLAGDRLEWADEEARSEIESDWASRYLWGQWKAEWIPGVRSTTLASVGQLRSDRLGDGGDPEDGVFKPLDLLVTDHRDFDVAQLKQDWEFDLSGSVVLKAGADYKWSSTSYDYFRTTDRLGVGDQNQLVVLSDTTTVIGTPDGTELGAYGSLRVALARNLLVEAGARFDRQTHTDDSDWAPRFLARWDMGAGTSLRASWGRYFQSQGIHEMRVENGESTFSGNARAEQVAIGVERSFGRGWSARVEGYRRTIDDPLPWYSSLAREVDPVPETTSDFRLIDPDEGLSRGVEALVDYSGPGVLNGTVSYTLSEAKDQVDGSWVPRTLDQRHALNVFASWSPSRAWQLSTTWYMRSGWPITNQELEVEVVSPVDGGPAEVVFLDRGFGPLNGDRLPSYRRLDLRVTRTFFSDSGRLEVFLDVFNALGRENLRGFEYFLRDNGQGRLVAMRDGGEELLPRLPTVGFRWTF